MIKPKRTSLRQQGMRLRKQFPGDVPVRIRRAPDELMGGNDADIQRTPSAYILRINKDIPLQLQKEALWHEWAHIRAGWSANHHHTNAWGKWYAKIYKFMQKEI